MSFETEGGMPIPSDSRLDFAPFTYKKGHIRVKGYLYNNEGYVFRKLEFGAFENLDFTGSEDKFVLVGKYDKNTRVIYPAPMPDYLREQGVLDLQQERDLKEMDLRFDEYDVSLLKKQFNRILSQPKLVTNTKKSED